MTLGEKRPDCLFIAGLNGLKIALSLLEKVKAGKDTKRSKLETGSFVTEAHYQ